jgi:hypothetical protein
MNRGDRWEEVFVDDKDQERFAEMLAEPRAKAGWLHAWLDLRFQIGDC